jgi:Mrp family chromosome partitioning ATPase
VKTDKLTWMDMLFAKHCDPHAAGDLIHSTGLQELMEQAREVYDYVVIDLPPMAIVPDPEAVMEFADGSLLVIRQNGVRAADLNRAIRDLQRGKAKLLGCVLNNVFTTATFSGEGYGVGYGRYGKYGGYGKYGRYAAYAVKKNAE